MSRRAERGVALLVALVAAVVVLSASILLAMQHAGAVRLHRQEAVRLRLDALADSAVDASLAGLARYPFFRGLDPEPLGAGEIASEIEILGADHRRITATARLAGVERRLEVEVRLDPDRPRIVAWRPLGFGPG
ncbi:MAG TPA: hypothetical protein VLA75_02920 [Thermoanaerobaculia bacterium]|nr:hypothetical protein [Thermoanaerobaculia bacterium]